MAEEVAGILPCVPFVAEFGALDSPPQLLFVSAGSQELLGVAADELILDSTAALRFVPREDAQVLCASLREAARICAPWRHEFRVRLGDKIRWVEAHALFDPADGGRKRARGHCAEITERKQSELERQRLKERLEQVLNAVTVPMAMFDSAENLIAVNAACTRLLGYAKKDIPTLAACFERLFANPTRRARALGKWRAALERARRSGRAALPFIERVQRQCGGERVVQALVTVADDEVIIALNDITERVHAKLRQRRAAMERDSLRSQLNLQAERMPMGLVICDATEALTVREWNPAAERIFGYRREEIIGKSPYDLFIPPGRAGQVRDALRWNMGTDDTVRLVGQDCAKDGRTIWCEWFHIPLRDGSGRVTRVMAMVRDITDCKVTQERVARLVQYDALTDLPNRALLMERLEQAVRGAERSGKRVAVALVGLDRFKEVNDSLGHRAGDQLLQGIAKRLTGFVRATDTVARVGNDEFVMLLQGLGSEDDVSQCVARVLESLKKPSTVEGREITVTASAGISIYPDDAHDAQELLRNADAALYQAKLEGRDRLRYYTGTLALRALKRLSLETSLRQALERGELELYYQPQVDVASGALVSAEALIRWNHPQDGLLMPGAFIPFAEERGLIGAIDHWVLGEAVRQLSAWRQAGLSAVPVALNLSSMPFRDKDFVARVAAMIRESGIAADRVELELTETIMMRDVAASVAVMKGLHDMGVRISIDDFGTGYSSLSYLQRLPLDKLKIDKSFVKEMASDAGAGRIVNAIIGLAKSLGLTVIAEGVETQEQLRMLRELGCDQAQGYLFSRAIPAAAFEDFARVWRGFPQAAALERRADVRSG